MRKLEREKAAAEDTAARLKSDLARTRDSLRDPEPDLRLPDSVQWVIENVRRERLTYLPVPHLTVLARQVAAAEAAERRGAIIEAGTALGGSAIAMAAAKSPSRPMYVYDVFGQIPPPSERDGEDVHERYEQIAAGESRGLGGDLYYGYHDDLLAKVTASFARHGFECASNNISLVEGLFEDTMDLAEPVAFAHLDGDWYDSTMTCLERIAPLVVPGGRIVLDDYFNWSGSRTAVDEYFADRTDFRLEYRAKVHAVRI